MSLANGRSYLAIPGPSVMPDRVLQAMHRPAPNIYSGELVDLVASVVPDLKAIAGTNHNVAIYIANGHGIWEAALANTLAPGETVLALATGRFGAGWAEMAARIGINPRVLDFGLSATYDLEVIKEVLRADTECEIKAITTVQVDTSTSVRNDIKALRDAIDEVGHPALLMVDCIACLGCEEFRMDDWGVDVMIAASQKGLMTPPGVGFVFFGPKAAEARNGLNQISAYWDWNPRANPDEFYQYFAGTAPTHHLFALREALTMLVHEEGLENAYARHKTLARAVWAALEAWGKEGSIALNIADESLRSFVVTSVNIDAPNATALRDYLTENLGVTLGIGLGMAPSGSPEWHGHFRIGHMGHVNAHMVLGVIGCIDAGLKALNIQHGSGAMDAAVRVIAEA
ncbi:aminotransferase class V-fold PLP-dependent enzyme [Halocynthiibacter sp. C4]|uniref:pyridoxal-phosphate-dependent aminotransferase family protein n=1 Tax=Halocynthiibacter sp. C4 TaxID=2992758 RepID=UPI00237A7687|nr:aminotransferase class V-fold PLP-dependent enzyme [Halocynthiibacter sp. C4]MDE0588968.1 aminotransferase class V-fold PLP-dependent enzyme [Halocynthiibacter sp. C4]